MARISTMGKTMVPIYVSVDTPEFDPATLETVHVKVKSMVNSHRFINLLAKHGLAATAEVDEPTWSADVDKVQPRKTRKKCPSCGEKGGVSVVIGPHPVPFKDEHHERVLNVVFPEYTCSKCDFVYRDHESEYAIDDAISDYRGYVNMMRTR